jgi:hypothetical protein
MSEVPSITFVDESADGYYNVGKQHPPVVVK